MFRVELPIPPSVNNAYVNVLGRGRVPSAAHKTWKSIAGWQLKIAKPPKILGPYRFSIELPMTLRGDCSNRIKLAEDLLVEMGVTPDDRHALSTLAERKDYVPSGRCIVQVEAA